MLYQHPDLPDTIRSGLSNKVDQLLKVGVAVIPSVMYSNAIYGYQMYSNELARVEAPHHVVTGGFHFNPKAIELALKVNSLYNSSKEIKQVPSSHLSGRTAAVNWKQRELEQIMLTPQRPRQSRSHVTFLVQLTLLETSTLEQQLGMRQLEISLRRK